MDSLRAAQQLWAAKKAASLRGSSGFGGSTSTSSSSTEVGILTATAAEAKASERSGEYPQVYVLISGKRCSGKDFVAERAALAVDSMLGWTGASRVLRLADAVKRNFARDNGLEFERLISQTPEDRAYKEEHRNALTAYFNEMRPSLSWFCSQAMETGRASGSDGEPPPSVVLVADFRHPLEGEWLEERVSSVIRVRVEVADETRRKRGWVAEPEKDSHVTETGLDSFTDWDLIVHNDPDGPHHVDGWAVDDLLPLIAQRLRGGSVPGDGISPRMSTAFPHTSGPKASPPSSVLTPLPDDLPTSPLAVNPTTRSVKIVASLGPASWRQAPLEALVVAGVDIFRLNCSHRQAGAFEEMIPRIRALSERTGKELLILGDLQGPKVRISHVKDGYFDIHDGNFLQIDLMDDYKDISQFYRLTLADTPTQRMILESLEEGQRVLLDDGLVELEVTARRGPTSVKTRVVRGGRLHSNKGVNVPDLNVKLPALTEADLENLDFFLRAGVDYLALSFVQDQSDLEALRAVMDAYAAEAGPDAPPLPLVIPKIEKGAALGNIDAILELSDGLMVARGDLGVEIGLHKVPRAQTMLLSKAAAASKFSITATQVFESMINARTPTRAEVSDCYNAVLGGSCAVMLSGETAMGTNPKEVIEWMDRVICEAETDMATDAAEGQS